MTPQQQIEQIYNETIEKLKELEEKKMQSIKSSLESQNK